MGHIHSSIFFKICEMQTVGHFGNQIKELGNTFWYWLEKLGQMHIRIGIGMGDIGDIGIIQIL